ncbi:MAG: sugar phosphate isomerase/epimerase [Elusimicrobia bacterium]|nr:sugar phosphate isomerase/epimerase [Elusimicrobiota bacterium]
MKLGFLTACLQLKLEDIVSWAKQENFETLEVACWPKVHGRDFASSHIDVLTLDNKKTDEIKKLFNKNNITISSLAYYDNMLTPKPDERETKIKHLKKVIDAGKLLNCDLVGTFVGRDPGKTIKDNLKEYKKVFTDLVEYAEKKNIRLMIENCPMVGWQFEGLPGTVSFSPELWEEMFKMIPSKNFGLNFDPSHLYWLHVDYLQAIKKYSKYIFHAHAKDTIIKKDLLSQKSIYGDGWWQARMPGLGEIDWSKFISTLKEAGYDGVLSIEHEDPVWSGSEEKIKKGLVLAAKHLKPLLV